jgi:hypothetical protein
VESTVPEGLREWYGDPCRDTNGVFLPRKLTLGILNAVRVFSISIPFIPKVGPAKAALCICTVVFFHFIELGFDMRSSIALSVLLDVTITAAQCPWRGPPVFAKDEKDRLAAHEVDDQNSYLTTDTGVFVTDQGSLNAGSRGPTLLEDFRLRQKLQHFDHERVGSVQKPFISKRSR